MAIGDFLDRIITHLPEIEGPKGKLGFKQKVTWTLTILVLYFFLGLIPLYGLGANALAQFEFLSTVLGASFGSLISLGIGPIVTASIVLQLLNGAGIIRFDLTSHEGKRRYQGVQKLLAILFVILEGTVYVRLGGLSPMAGIPPWILILQIFLGGILVMFMDEVVSKWGFGSGISLFIAAGVSQGIFIRLFSPFKGGVSGAEGAQYSSGKVWQLFQATAGGDTTTAAIALLTILFTLLVFIIAVYTQAMKVEIPLSFARVRGHGIRWPLAFFYTSNIPVILTAALLANVQIVARLVGASWSNTFVGWVTPHNLVQLGVSGGVTPLVLAQSLTYVALFVVFSVVFALFWVQTAGLDARSQANQIMRSGLQIPGFRKDPRVLERMLERYIWPLTVLGAIAVGLIASFADLTGALGSGTGILLTVMIVYRMYMDIAQQHMMDVPGMRKLMGG
jgi:preprotein translocase subunit SecY